VPLKRRVAAKGQTSVPTSMRACLSRPKAFGGLDDSLGAVPDPRDLGSEFAESQLPCRKDFLDPVRDPGAIFREELNFSSGDAPHGLLNCRLAFAVCHK